MAHLVGEGGLVAVCFCWLIVSKCAGCRQIGPVLSAKESVFIYIVNQPNVCVVLSDFVVKMLW